MTVKLTGDIQQEHEKHMDYKYRQMQEAHGADQIS